MKAELYKRLFKAIYTEDICEIEDGFIIVASEDIDLIIIAFCNCYFK